MAVQCEPMEPARAFAKIRNTYRTATGGEAEEEEPAQAAAPVVQEDTTKNPKKSSWSDVEKEALDKAFNKFPVRLPYFCLRGGGLTAAAGWNCRAMGADSGVCQPCSQLNAQVSPLLRRPAITADLSSQSCGMHRPSKASPA